MRVAFVGLILVVAFPALASNPGQPIDCTDWIFNEPGLTCQVVVPRPCENTAFEGHCSSGSTTQSDNEGRVLRVYTVAKPNPTGPCNDAGRVTLTATLSDGTEQLVAYVEDRCSSEASDVDKIRHHGDWHGNRQSGGLTQLQDPADSGYITFDDKNGKLYVGLSSCVPGVACSPRNDNGLWLAVISGFATTFDVLQSFTPSSSDLGFSVPYMPEGMNGADWFDTYYADLSTVGDWSQLQPLQCAYPASPPTVGDYLTVADTVPTPPPGQGVYYITAANFMGETRMGRKASGGKLSGRDPTTLPVCE